MSSRGLKVMKGCKVKTNFLLLVLILLISAVGCETVHKTTKKGGEYVGKGTAALGGVTEGAAEGYKGKETSEENPFGR